MATKFDPSWELDKAHVRVRIKIEERAKIAQQRIDAPTHQEMVQAIDDITEFHPELLSSIGDSLIEVGQSLRHYGTMDVKEIRIDHHT